MILSEISDVALWQNLAGIEQVLRIKREDMAKLVEIIGGHHPRAIAGNIHPMLQRHGLGLDDIDVWELNEAFAAQVLGCQAAWASDEYCREQLELPGALGKLDDARLNVDGGAVSIGHPVGASGARIVLHLLHVLRRQKARRGIATICIGGGLGGAMLVEAEA